MANMNMASSINCSFEAASQHILCTQISDYFLNYALHKI